MEGKATLLQARTKQFALRIIKLYRALPKTGEAQVIGRQILRSGTSVAANYRAACRSRSDNEFYSKISIVVEEADETQFWMELLVEPGIIPIERLSDLMNEGEEILKIMSSSRRTCKQKLNSQSDNRKSPNL